MRDREVPVNKTKQYVAGKGAARHSAGEHHSFARRSRSKSSGGKQLLLLLALLVVLFRVGNDAMQRRDAATTQRSQLSDAETVATNDDRDSAESIAGGLIIKADPSGHFRGKLLIDDVEMPFLIDTGATQTVIPQALAEQANLPQGRVIQTSTAGGQVNNHLTRINRMQLGNAELKNLQAIINPHLDEVLIGMNTLKYFRITQQRDTLTLIASNEIEPVETQERDLPLQMPPPAFMAELPEPDQSASEATETPFSKPTTQWKKSTDCSPGKRCVPSYSAQ